MTDGPTPFELHPSGAMLHGTKADLAVGDLLAIGPGRERIYLVEPVGVLEDDPNVTDRKFPGNPTRSFRTREPVRVVGELDGWVGHSAEQVRAMRERVAQLLAVGAPIYDD